MRPSVNSYGRARQTLQNVGSRDAELGLKRSVRYGGNRVPRSAGPAPHPSFFGLTLVSCEKGDIRQSAQGVCIYGEDEQREVPISTDDTGRDAVVRELYDAVVKARVPAHGGRWGKANQKCALRCWPRPKNAEKSCSRTRRPRRTPDRGQVSIQSGQALLLGKPLGHRLSRSSPRGRIWARSQPGQGSIFTFTIPARRSE